MSGAESAAALAEAYGVTVEAWPADSNPHMPNEQDGLRHWECVLTPEGGTPVTLFVSLGDDLGDEPPTAAEALSLVLADVALYRSVDGFAEFAVAIGADDGDAAAEAAWTELGRLDGSLSASFPDGFEGPFPERDENPSPPTP